MTTPRRCQLRRGQPRMGLPEGITAKRVSNPSRFRNPHDWRSLPGGRAEAVRLFRQHLLGNADLLAAARRELRGHYLACYCPRGEPCHADVLLELANHAPGMALSSSNSAPIDSR
jgi:hypothetical protein